MGPICCPETSVNNYHTTPRNIPEERATHVVKSITDTNIFSLNSPCIFTILDIHQQNAQINKGAKLAPCHDLTLFSNAGSVDDTCKVMHYFRA
jgi:hypothetical protein